VRIVSVLNYKGGVGKTTVTANLGADIARRGRKVLLIDLDPQASLTFSFYPPSEWDPDATIYRWYESYIMSGKVKSLAEFVVTPPGVSAALDRGRLDLIGSDLRLVDVELDLAHGLGGARYQTFNPEYLKVYRMLADSLAALDDYDFVLIDCPPNFNMVARTAIVASDHILVPAKADYLSTLGISYLRARLTRLIEEYDLVAGMNNTINPVILGVVFTMVQYSGTNLMNRLQAYVNNLRELELPVFQQTVRESKAVFADSGVSSVPVVLSPQTNPNVEYDLQQLTSEFLARIRT
jgi:chromosome partitioning protein